MLQNPAESSRLLPLSTQVSLANTDPTGSSQSLLGSQDGRGGDAGTCHVFIFTATLKGREKRPNITPTVKDHLKPAGIVSHISSKGKEEKSGLTLGKEDSTTLWSLLPPGQGWTLLTNRPSRSNPRHSVGPSTQLIPALTGTRRSIS